MKILIILLILASTSVNAQVKRIAEKHCFTEQKFAQEAVTLILSRYNHNDTNSSKNHIIREHLNQIRPKIELVTDTVDQFGRTFCLIVMEKKLTGGDLKTIGTFQFNEDLILKEKNRKFAQSIKDPWGGDKLELTGKPKVLRSCRRTQSSPDEKKECDDLIITARHGDDNVIEYRFWLGFQSGEGLAVYKSPANHVELSKVMGLLKKDRKEQKYSFAPQGAKEEDSIDNATIIGE